MPGFEDYIVSSWGRVARFRNGPSTFAGRILKPIKGTGKYLQVRLGKRPRIFVHKIIAAAFLGPRPDKMQIDHLDGNPINNYASNLEYVTQSVNQQRAFKMGLNMAQATRRRLKREAIGSNPNRSDGS